MKKQTLEVYTALVVTARHSVNVLREQYLNGRPGEAEVFCSCLERIRAERMPAHLQAKDAEFYVTADRLLQALFEQLAVSHELLRLMYKGQSGALLHSYLLDEAFTRSEKVLETILSLAMDALLGTPRHRLRA